MLKVRIIPCLDVKDGRVVKGVNFVSLRDAGDPVEQAMIYDAAGADELCFLDITASHEKRPILLDVVRRTASACFMPLTVGGGVRTLDDIRALLLAGADKVSINTEAVRRPEIVREGAEKFGSQCIVAAIDAKRVERAVRGLHAWRSQRDRHRRGRARGEAHRNSARAKSCSPRWIATGRKRATISNSRAQIADAVSVPVIACGGVGSLDDLVAGVLEGHASAVLAASIFHFGEATIHDAKAASGRGRNRGQALIDRRKT